MCDFFEEGGAHIIVVACTRSMFVFLLVTLNPRLSENTCDSTAVHGFATQPCIGDGTLLGGQDGGCGG